jgi:hypothetical protein
LKQLFRQLLNLGSVGCPRMTCGAKPSAISSKMSIHRSFRAALPSEARTPSAGGVSQRISPDWK